MRIPRFAWAFFSLTNLPTMLDHPPKILTSSRAPMSAPITLDRFHTERSSTDDPQIRQRLLELLHARVGDPRVGEVEILQSGQSLQVRDYSVIDTTAGKPKGRVSHSTLAVAEDSPWR
jgi:hypothetical protein